MIQNACQMTCEKGSRDSSAVSICTCFSTSTFGVKILRKKIRKMINWQPYGKYFLSRNFEPNFKRLRFPRRPQNAPHMNQ